MRSTNNSRACSSKALSVTPLRAIAIILAHGVLRLQQRQKQLDNPTEQSVHDVTLATNEEML